MEGKVRSFSHKNTAFCIFSLLRCAHPPTPADTVGQSPTRQLPETSWPRRRPPNSRYFPATQLHRWPKQQFASALHRGSMSSEESRHLPSPRSTFLPGAARPPQTDTDAVSPAPELEAVAAECRPQSGKDDLSGGLSPAGTICPQAAVSKPPLSRHPLLLTHSCRVQVLFSGRS